MDRRAKIREHYQSFMIPFDPVVRDEKIIELCLAGWSIKDIATKVKLSTTRVRVIARSDDQNRYKKYLALAREKRNAQNRLKRKLVRLEKPDLEREQVRRDQLEKLYLERKQVKRAQLEKLELERERAIAEREQMMDDLCTGTRGLVKRRYYDPEFKKRMDEYLAKETGKEFLMRRRANPDCWQNHWS